jgi:signal transduction histidine kinase
MDEVAIALFHKTFFAIHESSKSDMQVKTTITSGLTQAYVRKLGRENYLATLCCIFIVTFSLLWLIFQFGSQSQVGKMNVLSFFSDAMYAIASFIGAFWCVRVTWRARYGPVRLEPRHQLAWLLISLGLLSNGIGGVIYTYFEDYIQRNPVPAPSDVGFTLFYIFTFVGLLLMPRAIGMTRSRVRIALDATITTLCILAFSWFFVIRPIFSSISDPAMLYVSASYPFWDILLVLAIVLVLYQGIEPVLYPSLILCALGIFCQIGADTLYAITVPQGTYMSGTWYIDSFWFLGYLLIGLSAPYQYTYIARSVYRAHISTSLESTNQDDAVLHDTRASRRRSLRLHIFLTYIPLFLLLALVFYNAYSRMNDIIVLGLALIIAACVVLRWILANYENDRLLEEREQRLADADLLRRLTVQLAEETQLESLLTRILTAVTADMRFDAAMLLLLEDIDQPLDAQSHLLVRTTLANSSVARTWRLQDERPGQYAMLQGKPIEVDWTERAIQLPEELSAWRKEQHIYSTLFLPLVYQGRLQGSLGFATCSRRPFNTHNDYLARAFIDQVSASIEHVKLYEQAHEHERFAQALTAVAARLNSTIATGLSSGTEIFQLICEEGARALSADYAILYVPGRNGQLFAAASYTDMKEANGQEWPVLGSHEKDAGVLNELQPVLIHVFEATASGKLPAISGTMPAISGPLPALLAPVSLRQVDTAPHRAQTGSMRTYRHLSLRAALARRSVQTAILAPLLAGNQAVALLVLARSNKQNHYRLPSFATTELGQAQDFAEQAAIAFTNAQLYQQLRDAHRQLQELDQLKDQFMVTASHELRTPLTAVQGYLELLAEFDANLPPEQRREFLQKARRGCEELVLLLSNVMDASRLEIEAGIRPALMQRVSMQELIDDVIMLVEPQLKQEWREVKVYLPSPIYVKADPARVRQVLLNLSSNALKYSPVGTPLTYHARVLPDRSSAIIGVTDKGKGIRPEDQSLLFQRFVRLESDLNSSVRGSGLGLYISRRLIEAMNGRLWVESSGIPGAGSTFYIQLPLA